MFGKLFRRKNRNEFQDHWDFEPFYALAVPILARILASAFEDRDDVYAVALVNSPRWEAMAVHVGTERVLAAHLTNGTEHEDYYRWIWVEWGDGSYLGDVADLQKLDDWVKGYIGKRFEADPRATSEEMRRMMEELIRRLDLLGAFGTGADRARILVFPAVQEGMDETWSVEAARALNPEATLAQADGLARALGV